MATAQTESNKLSVELVPPRSTSVSRLEGHETPEIKAALAEILGIEVSDAWAIFDVDAEHNLYLVHYKQAADLNRWGDVRGIVVDLKARTVVCRSYGYTPMATSNQLEVAGDGYIHVTDIYGGEHTLDPNQIDLKVGYEGTIMRVFKHDGKVYHTTHRRLFTDRSKWGSSITFDKMYEQLNGPADDVLFDPNVAYSPYCHLFLMVHPDVLNVTKDDVGPGYMVYLGPKQMWNPDEVPYDDVDETLYLPEVDVEADPKSGLPKLISPRNLDLASANQHLTYGFYGPDEFDLTGVDERLWPGEFIIVYQKNGSGQIESLLKIQSVAYEWRSNRRNNDPNLLHAFYLEISSSLINARFPEGLARYQSLYPLLSPLSPSQVLERLEQGPIVVWPEQSEAPLTLLNTQTGRQANVWRAFLMAVPLHRQVEVAQFYDEFRRQRVEVVEWLKELYRSVNYNRLTVPERAKEIIQLAVNLTQKKLEQASRGVVVIRSGYRDLFTSLVHRHINEIVMNEWGTSLYKLVRARRQYLRDLEDEPQEV